MLILHLIMLSVLAAACFYFSYTDLKRNQIQNRLLLLFAIIACALDAVYYIGFDTDGVGVFFLNVGIMTAVSIVLYAAYVWAAGDSKLLILISLLIPAELTYAGEDNYFEFMIPVYAFAGGFLFLAGDTVNQLFHKKQKISGKEIMMKFRQYLLQMVINCLYILTILKIEDYVFRKFGLQLGGWEIIVNLCALILISHFSFFRKWEVVMLTALASALYSVGTGIWMMNWYRLLYYLIIVVFMIVQILIGEFNYKEIPTQEVRAGMVLSFFTVMSFQNSRVQGLPDVSTEDMKSRLTQEQAEAVKRWGKTKRGKQTVMIVRKIPFAVFISFGTVVYLLVVFMHRG